MGLINPEDMDLMQVIDEPDQVLEAVLKFYEDKGEDGEKVRHERPDSDEDRMFYL
jgi:predicted Rossmann-fold nucleotide-binding protein